jgi:hypothetical protein
MGRLVDDRNDLGHAEPLCEPAWHQVHGIIARRCHERIGPVDPGFFEDRLVGRIARDRQHIMVLQDIGAARFFLVHDNNIVAVPDRLPYK